MKKWIALALAAAMMLALCACGGTTNSASGSTPQEAQSTGSDSSLGAESAASGSEASESAEPEDAGTAESVTSTDYMTIDGIYVDESYVDDDSESIRMVYLFYTLTTPDENLKVDSKSAKLTVNETNTYESQHYAGVCAYMSSYYYSDYLTDVYVGDTVKVVETFKIPVGDLEAGKTLSISKSQVPDTDKISLKTDDIQFCESPEAIAQLVDPTGYESETYNRTPADAETVATVQAYLNGYYWDVYVNSTSYELEFYEPNAFEMRVASLGVSNSGTYEVLNGYVVCTYTDTGIVLEIPYTWGTDDIELDVATALDVSEN